METVDAKKVETIKNPHGVKVGKLYDTQYAKVMHILLEPGESLKKHTTPVDVFFYVLEGVGIIEIGDEKKEATADILINSPANIPHCLHNKSNTIFRVLVVKLLKS